MCCPDIVFEGIRDAQVVIDLYGAKLLCELGLNSQSGYPGKDKQKREEPREGELFPPLV